MVALLDLWLPIVLSAVFVFLASSVIHMATPMHKKDYKPLPREDDVLASLRPHQLAPGNYTFPHASSMKEMGSPEFTEKLKRGPVGFVTLLPNSPMNMNRSLVQWFVFSLVVGVFVAYVTGRVFAPGADGGRVLQIASAIAFMAYGLSNVTDSIWKGVAWGVTARFLVDGLVYGLVTGATFCWLWPDLAA